MIPPNELSMFVIQVLAVPLVAAVAMSDEDKAQMQKEREQIEEERQKMIEERTQMEEDRENFQGGQKKWLDQINILQVQIGEKDKVSRLFGITEKTL